MLTVLGTVAEREMDALMNRACHDAGLDPTVEPCDRPNPFHLGEFEGERLHEERARRAACILVASLIAALIIVTFMAAHAWWSAAHSANCRVSAIDWAGDEYTIGQGDTLADAMVGAVAPDDVNVYVFEGCEP